MNSRIKLSICIATLNRGAFIGATLESIISQATEDVEIVIVDGASTDNTEDVVRFYQQKFPQLRYVLLPVKGGVDQDYCRAVASAQGEYCWLFTDDDLLKPGAIQAVLTAMEKNYGLILVNAEVQNATLSRVLQQRLLRGEKDMAYRPQDFEKFFIDTAEYLSFIGCVVIKRSLWNEREKEKYFGTVFIHVGVIFQKVPDTEMLVIAEPLISIRYGNALWTAKSFEITFFKWPELLWSFSAFSDAAKQQICQRDPWRNSKSLLVARARGVFSVKEYRTLVMPRLPVGMKRLSVRVIAQLPGRLLNAGLVFYFSILRHLYPSANIRLDDLKNSRFYYKNYLYKKS